jgi:heme/copper-type cytochrome/quinol oxidase subunit 4
MDDENLSIAETMRDLVFAAEHWSEELARRSSWLMFFVLVLVGVVVALQVVMVLRGLTPTFVAIIIFNWAVILITIQKYYSFMSSARKERDEWKTRFARLRERNQEILSLLNGS